MAKSSTKKRASKADKGSMTRTKDALKHKVNNIHDTLSDSTPTILTSLQGKSDQSACMSDATTPSPTSTGSSIASENGVNLNATDVGNASSECLDDLDKSNSETGSSKESKHKASKKKNQRRRETKKNTQLSCQESTSDAMDGTHSTLTAEETAHQPQNDQNTGIDTLTVPTIPDGKKDQPSPVTGAGIPSATLSPIGDAITKTDSYSTRDHDIWASMDDSERRPDSISSFSVPSTDFTDAFLSSNFKLTLRSVSEWETDHAEGKRGHNGPEDDELGQGRLLSQQYVTPSIQPRAHHHRQKPWLLSEGKMFPPLDSTEVVATSAIQCLTKANDMELSYVTILSAINILTAHSDSTDVMEDAARTNAKARHVEKLYSILLRIMTQKNIADRLGQETVRQGDLTPEALYIQLYSGILAHYHFQIHEADVLLKQYLALNAIKQAPGTKSDSGINYASLEQSRLRQSSIRKWFKVQLDASTWEEVKELYEQRRARLTVAPGQVMGLSNNASDSTETKLSQTMEPSTHIQFVKDPIAAQQVSDRFDIAKTKPRSFSFLSSLKLSSSSGAGSNTVATQKVASGTSGSTVSTQLQNRQLTTLDNHMLEECVSYKKYEYGWKQVYERMGPSLEDKDTARLVMRLCTRAFLSHSENNEKDGQVSLNASTDLYVDCELHQDDLNPADYGFDHVTWAERTLENCRQEDPDIWEARAWAIYNKAIMSPFALHNGVSPSPSPTVAHLSSQSHTSRNMASTMGDVSAMSPLSAMAGTKSLTMFLHNILKVSINSTDRSSRYQKAFRIYGMMRSDPFNQYQAQLRDPVVVTCVIKAVYDQVMVTSRRSEDTLGDDLEPGSMLFVLPAQQSNMSLSSIRSSGNSSPPICQLFDLAFEIYADMRNLGPVRHLPQLETLGSQTPMAKTPVAHQSSSSFFGRSSSTSSTVPPRTSSIVDMDTLPMSLQDLNPTLSPNPQARRLPSELYLALLHICIQVPDKRLSLQVVKTIVADMTISVGHQACDLDRHLAAALQMYHNRWMCLPVPAIPVRRFEKDPVEDEEPSAPDTGCIFREWMYRSEEYIQEHATSSSSSSSRALTSPSNPHAGLSQSESFPDQEGVEIVSPTGRVLDLDTIQAIHAIMGDKDHPTSSSSSSPKARCPAPEPAEEASEKEKEENDSSHYGTSKHDAVLDELDKYLGDARDQGTCNDRFYWDMIGSDTDPVLRSLQFSRKRARMLWRHVGRV
ncbi:hypothetical protein BG006_006678 [Podila minutissima]|uniref:Uncharacterized protein n=1 Tax=Podila minutissima TaxID=64525 RepID=A0A9P5SLB9_9FUNG|nr:hypothetical protein BG006_006678 [Podila minutissima]